jgi:hypothetical protein
MPSIDDSRSVQRPQARVALYIDPPSHHFLADRLFEDGPQRLNGDQQHAPYLHMRNLLRAAGVPVRTADYLPDAIDDTLKLYVSLGMLGRFERLAGRSDVVLSAFFAMECPIVEPRIYRALPRAAGAFRRVFSWSDSDSLRRFTGADLVLHHFRWPQSFDDVHEEIWKRDERKFLVMINANKLPRVHWQELYTERLRAVEFFSQTGEIDLFGKGWNEPSMRVGQTWVPWSLKWPWLGVRRSWDRLRPAPLLAAARRVYKGPAVSKAAVLGQYDFALCFENCILRGWITEKLFDCFFAGTVPVYWGPPEIADVVPPECFIDMRRFSDYVDLRTFLRSLGPVAIARYRQSAREFLRSRQFHPFSREAFTMHFARIVAEDGGERASLELRARGA